ncbi:MAG: LytR C-terminal domain-containing protein, partial [Eggerthellaceae bacterium]|nr:LytR C-terminal domain-containing protein [Eggerthellaceae bacterium]
ELGEAMRPLDSVVVYKAFVPGYEASGTTRTLFIDSTDKWKSMMQSVEAGGDPNSTVSAAVGVDRTAVTVEVRNGGGITGVGAKMGESLAALGYVVEKVGNTDDGTTYPETLVIYKDAAYESAAESIVSDLSAGRVVNGGDFYTFETNVLVIVGKDWIPVS